MENEPNKTKSVLLSIPLCLYEQFLASSFRRESQTDAEGLRATIRYAIDNDKESQGKSSPS